ncbi:hypothetical protein EBV26_19140, partial [bacterium]|nr:hypothetical protein [bacterium]
MNRQVCAQELLFLQDYLTNNFPGCLIAPIISKEDKRPLIRHKHGQWSEEKAIQCIKKGGCSQGAVILLRKNLIVIDVDHQAWVEYLEDLCPLMKNTVICKTKKGKHYYFRRTDDSDFIRDGATQMRPSSQNLPLSDGGKIPIDFKTETGTTTRGVIVIPPTPGKAWIRPFGPNDPLPVPKELISFIKDHLIVSKNKARTKKELPSSHSHGENVDDVNALVGMLAKSRADDRDPWIRVGWCLHNISPTPTFLDIWNEWSKQSPKYKDGECEYEWSQSENRGANGLNMGSLHMWAKEDNPMKYNDFISKNRSPSTIQALTQLCNGSHHSVATIAYYILSNKYKYDVINNKWYTFDGTLWKIDSNNICLRSDISTIIKSHYTKVLSEFSSKFYVQEQSEQSSTTTTSKKTSNNDTVTTLSKTLRNLQDRRFKENICHEMEEFFHDSKFFKYLDTNRNLIAFTNGVWDLKEKRFRIANSTDHQSLSVGYDHIETPNPTYAMKVKQYWETLHPNPEQRQYIIKMFSRQLQGDVGNNLFHIHAGHLGSAANGKSTCFEALECCLGDYMRKFGVEMLTTKQRPDPSKPHPELAYWKSRRILYTSEPNHDDVINSGVMKDYTGGEKLIYRCLYANAMDDFRPMFKMHIMTNDAPQVDGSDYGVRRRIRKIDYISEFVPKDQVNEKENKFLRDDNFLSELRETHAYKMEFLRYLLENYDDDFQFEMPECIANNSKEYIEENDSVFKFVQECIFSDKEGFLTLKDAKESFKRSDYYNGKIQTLKNDLIKC